MSSEPLYFKSLRRREAARFPWWVVKDGDLQAHWLASRHYSHPDREECAGNRQILPPGQKLLLVTEWGDAVAGFVRQKYRQDGQRGVYLSIFRNESLTLSSSLICAASLSAWDKWPGERLFTYVDRLAVRSSNPGYCFRKAGWRRVAAGGKRLLLFCAAGRRTS